MPRRPVERSKSNYYYITARSHQQECFYIELPDLWNLMTKKLGKLQKKFDIKVAAFVLLKNHFHLILLTPNEDIDRIMYFFMKELTLKIQKSTGRINKIFGGSYKASLIHGPDSLANVYKYVYRTPVEMGLSNRAEAYLYSSLLYRQMHYDELGFTLEEIQTTSDDLSWLNQKFNSRETLSIEWGLRKTVFAFGKDNSTGRPIVPSFGQLRNAEMLKDKCEGTLLIYFH